MPICHALVCCIDWQRTVAIVIFYHIHRLTEHLFCKGLHEVMGMGMGGDVWCNG